MTEQKPRGLVAADGLIALEGLLRILRAAGDTYGHDYEAIIIYWSVAMSSVGRLVRNGELAALLERTEPVPEEAHHAISARAIAEATGLPRETVRRKIALLVRDGHLAQDARGVHTVPPLLEERGNWPFVQLAAREIKRMAAAMETTSHLSHKLEDRTPG
jgi:predicted transcriptional regulator of viral defense system